MGDLVDLKSTRRFYLQVEIEIQDILDQVEVFRALAQEPSGTSPAGLTEK